MDELSYALKKGKIIVPVLYLQCEIPFRIDRILHSDFTKNYDKGFNDLLRAFDIPKEKKKTKLTIGKRYQGDKFFYIDASGQHGLIAAPVDQGKHGWEEAKKTCKNLVLAGYDDWY